MNELMKRRLLSVCLSVTYVFRQETNVQTTTKAGLLSALAGMACKAAAMALLVRDPGESSTGGSGAARSWAWDLPQNVNIPAGHQPTSDAWRRTAQACLSPNTIAFVPPRVQ